MPIEAPYKVKQDGDKYTVVNNAGVTKATFSSYAKALAYLRALYKNVPGAAKRADKVKWTGTQKRPVKAEAAAKPITMADGSYPIASQKDAQDAWNLRRHSKNHSEAAVVAHIRRACQKLGLKMPGAMMEKSSSHYGQQLDEDTLARLRAHYQLAAAAPPAGYDAETQVIARNATTNEAQQPHEFQPAVHLSSENASRRCLLCGMPEPADGMCDGLNPDQPGMAPDGPHSMPMAMPMASEETEKSFTSVTITSVKERVPTPMLQRPDWLPDSPGFVTELNGKTLVTAQATVDPALFEKAFTPNEHFLWTQGRLVGAERANRNGAFWTSGDLELGQATVKYGPLNWLHDGKHVIGTLAEGAFVQPGEQAGEGAFTQPHIAVVAPVWKWIYPEEASVIAMASDAGKFWYSMECISKAVQCVGNNGCGTELAYLDYIQGKGVCAHMTERSAVRRFVDPTFLGAAVIVPPVRPGWAEANATAMTQAAKLVEKAYEQAGRPDVAASEFEQLMAQVVQFATTG